MAPLHVLECPSCGANLDYDGGPQETITCGYCAKIVEVPPELGAAARQIVSPNISTPPVDPAALSEAVYARLRVHNKAGAVKIYMDLTHASFEDAETAVEGMMREGLGATNPLPPPDLSALDLSDPAAVNAKIGELVGAGFTQVAVDLYMRVYQVDAKDAYKAVSAIERGETAPVRHERADTHHDRESDRKKHELFGR